MIGPRQDNEIHHYSPTPERGGRNALLSWDEADPEKTDVVETGLGILIDSLSMSSSYEDKDEDDGEVHDVTFCIDGLGLSKPVTGEDGDTIEDVFPADSSYGLMSGTSQATPAVSGAYAVLASRYPMEEGQNPAEYALENRARFCSLVTRTDELKDLCSTGGYLDLSKINSETPEKPNMSITDAVCDLNKATLTLSGIDLKDGLKIYTKDLTDKDAEEILIPESRLSFAADGKSFTISDAKNLFGTYTEFIAKDAEGEINARASFFLVKGQKALEHVLTEDHKETYGDSDYVAPRHLFTDAAQKELYAYQLNSYDLYAKKAGVLYKFDGNKFVEYQGTRLSDAVADFYEESGYDRHQITRGLEVSPWLVRQPITENNILYDFVDVQYSPQRDAEEEEIERKTYLAALDYTSPKPKWTFREIAKLDPREDTGYPFVNSEITYCALGGKIYAIGGPDITNNELSDEERESAPTFVYALDISTCEWEKLDDYSGELLRKCNAYVNGGKIYLMFGKDRNGDHSNSVHCFDGKTWTKMKDIPFIGRHGSERKPVAPGVAAVKDGFVFFNFSVSGAGNVFKYNLTTQECEPMYYTLNDSLSGAIDDSMQSAAGIANGLYYVKIEKDDGDIFSLDLYRIPKVKKANTAVIKGGSAKVKRSTLKKKSVTKKVIKVTKKKGTVRYKLVSGNKKSKKALKVNTKTGKITIKKRTKKGKYSIRVRVTVSGNDDYKSKTKTVTVKIRVK